jgi:hypothetical protein
MWSGEYAPAADISGKVVDWYGKETESTICPCSTLNFE